ncbi:uL15 family ribosomal protein [Patescibacteria group bacterium]|nr:uL15 family ribosomal protein [Patescibacteria group bacterium]MBU2633414.1 uL15 family ribosomal protein [Patescibacteria group bacterium]
MQLHQIKPKNKKSDKKRVGRGGKRGSYSGKGLKGQKSRAGRKLRPQMRDIIKKIPKKRGYRFKSIAPEHAVVNLDMIDKKFENGEKATPKIFFEKGLIKKVAGKLPRVKILARGQLTKKVFISGCTMSASAKEQIEKKH